MITTYVSGSTRYALAVWFDGSSSAVKASVRNGSSGTWSSPATLRAVVPAYFSIAPISLSTDTYWQFAWVESGNLYCAPIGIGITPVLGAPQLVATGAYYIQIHAPSIALIQTQFGNSNPAICWEEFNDEIVKRVIKYREYTKNGNWSTTVMVWAEPYSWDSRYYTPTLSSYPSSPNVSIVWRVGTTQQLRYVQRIGSAWTSQVNLTTGVDPMLSIGATYTGNELLLARGTGTLYPLQFTPITYGPPIESPVAALNSAESPEGRGGIVTLAEGTIGLAIEAATMNDAPVAFPAVNDTLEILDNTQFTAALTSEPFAPEGTLRLALRYAGSLDIPANMKFQIMLLEGETEKVIRAVRTFGGKKDTVLTLEVPMSERASSVRVMLRPVGIGNRAVYDVERWSLFAHPSSGAETVQRIAATGKEEHRGIPTTFGVSAFPNPFNPSAIITFDLPEKSNVSFAVYDVLGRKVAELANGYHEAGYHTVTWNATDAASGIYYARLSARDGSGNIKLIKTNKLVLMK